MPVFLIRRNPDGIASLDLADRPALRLHASDAGDDMQGLSKRMGVPRRARAGLEAHAARANARRRLDDRVLPRYAGERFLRLTARRYRAARFDVHECPPLCAAMIAIAPGPGKRAPV